MGNLFSGLEAFGLKKLENMDLYASDQADKVDKNGEKEATKAVFSEADVLFDKTYTCPVCDKEFKAKNVRTGKAQLVSADTDLRPKYNKLDSLKYDAVLCPFCGYAALNRFFNYMTSSQAKLIKTQISATYQGKEFKGDFYTYEEAISRHKMALVNTIVKKGKNSEKAYTCLKLGWLYRGMAETLDESASDYEQKKKELYEEELECLKNAYDGFMSAFSKEAFPMCGMDEYTTTYLVADLARRCGMHSEASRWVSKVLVARDANNRIKDKARELKELLRTND